MYWFRWLKKNLYPLFAYANYRQLKKLNIRIVLGSPVALMYKDGSVCDIPMVQFRLQYYVQSYFKFTCASVQNHTQIMSGTSIV